MRSVREVLHLHQTGSRLGPAALNIMFSTEMYNSGIVAEWRAHSERPSRDVDAHCAEEMLLIENTQRTNHLVHRGWCLRLQGVSSQTTSFLEVPAGNGRIDTFELRRPRIRCELRGLGSGYPPEFESELEFSVSLAEHRAGFSGTLASSRIEVTRYSGTTVCFSESFAFGAENP